MPQTPSVTEFLQKLDYFYEMVEDSDNHNDVESDDRADKPRVNGRIPNGLSESGEGKLLIQTSTKPSSNRLLPAALAISIIYI